jgi:hypothetical protein
MFLIVYNIEKKSGFYVTTTPPLPYQQNPNILDFGYITNNEYFL